MVCGAAEQWPGNTGVWSDVLALVVDGEVVHELDASIQHPEQVGLVRLPPQLPSRLGERRLPEETTADDRARHQGRQPATQPRRGGLDGRDVHLVWDVEQEVGACPWAVHREWGVGNRRDAEDLRGDPHRRHESEDDEVRLLPGELGQQDLDDLPGAGAVGDELGSVVVRPHDRGDLVVRELDAGGTRLEPSGPDLLLETLL